MSTLEHATEPNSATASKTRAATPDADRIWSAAELQAARQGAAGKQVEKQAEKLAHQSMTNNRRDGHSSNNDDVPDEAAEAKAAIGRVAKALRHSLGTAVDVRLWTKKGPWIAVGVAAATGLASAILIRRGANSEPSARVPPTLPPKSVDTAKPAPPPKSGIGASVASSLFDLAKYGLETAIMAGIRETAARKFDTADSQSTSNTDVPLPPRR